MWLLKSYTVLYVKLKDVMRSTLSTWNSRSMCLILLNLIECWLWKAPHLLVHDQDEESIYMEVKRSGVKKEEDG